MGVIKSMRQDETLHSAMADHPVHLRDWLWTRCRFGILNRVLLQPVTPEVPTTSLKRCYVWTSDAEGELGKALTLPSNPPALKFETSP